MTDQDTTLVRCPTCGSPISLGAMRSGACPYCGTVVEQRPDVSQSVPNVIWRPDSARLKAQPGAGGCVVAIILATVLFVGFILAATTLSLRQIRSALGLDYAG